MQTFKATDTGEIFAFEDNVVVEDVNGVFTFKTAEGTPLLANMATLTPYTPPITPPVMDPKNGYWEVAGYQAKLWSSAAVAWVPANDATLAAWLSNGYVAGQIANLDKLAELLTKVYPVGVPKTPASERWLRQNTGYWFTPSAAGSTPFLVAIDPTSQGNLTAAYAMARDGYWVDGIKWKGLNGTGADVYTPMAAADVTALALATSAYISSLFMHEADLATQCITDPTIDVTQGWPANGTPPN